MHEINLAGVDLNLLVALHALLEEGSVTKAARRVAITQPSMSHALGRLRTLFDDPLFVRTGSGMVPTERAEELRAPLEEVLSETARIIRRPSFDPMNAKVTIRIATTEYVTPLVIPRLLRALQHKAPGIRLELQRWRRPETWADLQNGKAHLAMHGALTTAPAGFYRKRLFSDSYACVLRKGHPIADRRLTLKRFVTLKHALITVTGVGKGHVNEYLEGKGLSRDVVLSIPSFIAAPTVVAQSDLIMTVPARLADLFAEAAGLVVLKPPMPLPEYDVSMVWHERVHRDPANKWFRDLVSEQTQDLNHKRSKKR